MAEHRPAGSTGPSPSQERRTQGCDTTQEVRTQGRDPARHVSETASVYAEQGREQIEHAGQYLEEHIREKPLKAALIAAGIGVLLGLLWKR